jgi:hypothetical protein
MDSQTSPPPVEYAPGEPPARRRLRRLVLPAILLTLVVSAIWWAPLLWFRTQVWYWQRRCATYEASPDVVVSGKAPAADGGAASSTTAVVPTEWTRFYNLVSPPGFISNGTAFLHERRRPDGDAVIVAVDVVRGVAPPTLEFRVRVFKPGDFIRSPLQVQDDVKYISVPPPSEYRVYAGAPDPADPSHFDFRYDFAGHTSRIDGWVRDDGVVLQERRTTTQPLPALPG